ncbi:FtsX-like permease family protein [Vagococcus sp.]|uniref:FtsX-like permease family protein n=1 Tax=Vagococcus sp. TaxID=1933889 RepID=UPI003F9925A2
MVGKGSIDYFALVPFEDFSLEEYTELYIQYRQTTKKNSYSSSYKKEVEQAENKVKAQLEKVAQNKNKKQVEQFIEAERKLKAGRLELTQAKSELVVKQKELEQTKKQLVALGTTEATLPEELKKSEEQLKAGLAEIESKSVELAKQESELKENKDLFEQLDAEKYTYLTRDSDTAYAEYQDNADRLSSIATVFPVFFFMIAALISLTTMTRMVDEKRNEIGALKALGYTNWEIAQKFIVYAVSASLLGSLLGLVIGYHVFPTVIYNAYRSLYNLPDIVITYYWSYSLQSVLVALACTLISALVVLRVDLLSTPASLLRPKAPKPGKRILLERITWLWKKMNFNQKVTARNLFRYKQRMLMTVLGIAGCTAMIVTGFGIKDAIGDIVDLQFSKIWHYDASIILNTDITAPDSEAYLKERDELSGLKEHLALSQRRIKVSKPGVNTQEVTLDTPENVEELSKFVVFKDRETQKNYKLSDEGVIINEKLAQLMTLKSGDNIEIEDGAGKRYQVKVQQIVENYALHFMYMTPTYYEKIFDEKPEYNADLLKFKSTLTKNEEEEVAQKLMKVDHVVNVGYTSDIGKQMDDTMGSLNIVVWVLIVSAALLAFIVLYNLTNINISERIRELSTIKVLGFYDREVTLYIYRENNILTALGILLGWVLGKLLHTFVLKTAEVDVMMFPPIIHPISYAYAAGLTVLFSLIVMFFMHRKLKHVDMIEALKSVD